MDMDGMKNSLLKDSGNYFVYLIIIFEVLREMLTATPNSQARITLVF